MGNQAAFEALAWDQNIQASRRSDSATLRAYQVKYPAFTVVEARNRSEMPSRLFCKSCKEPRSPREWSYCRSDYLDGGGYRYFFNPACNWCYERASAALKRAVLSSEYWSPAKVEIRKQLGLAYSAERTDRVRQATPPWVDKKAIAEIYRKCRAISIETGALHHVDHIAPITHPDSCGLHVPWNLRIVRSRENLTKSNTLNEELVLQPSGTIG